MGYGVFLGLVAYLVQEILRIFISQMKFCFLDKEIQELSPVAKNIFPRLLTKSQPLRPLMNEGRGS